MLLVAVNWCPSWCRRKASVEDGLEAVCLLRLTPISSQRHGLVTLFTGLDPL